MLNPCVPTLIKNFALQDTYLFKLSEQPHLALFRGVVLVSAADDRYVPMHSARIQVSRSFSRRNDPQSSAVSQMVKNLLNPIEVCHFRMRKL